MKFNHSVALFSIYSLIGGLFQINPTLAQITADGTTSTTIDVEGNNFTINNGNRGGENLFHSFRDFSVPKNSTAFFNNSLDISNIFSRVTGGKISQIDGLIRAHGNANLFLINPAGIIFGQGARLDIGGSFYGSTADSILFPDGIEFSATNTRTQPILSINAPIGLDFRGNSGDITLNKSTLQVDQGKTLALVGGNLDLKGSSLIARQGRIELGSITNNNLVNLNQTAQGIVLDYGQIQSSGEIQLVKGAKVETSGEGGGAIQIQGGLVSLADESMISAETQGSADGAGINFIINQLVIKDGSQISASSLEKSQGNSGEIVINAVESVKLIGTSVPESNNGSGGGGGNGSGGGRGGGNNSTPRERPSRLANDTQGNGRSGNLTINTRELLVLDGARISASTAANSKGGNIVINAELIELAGISPERERPSGLSVQTRDMGQAGDLIVRTNKLIVRDGAEISASTFGEGNGGSINLTATESIEVIGNLEESNFSSIVAETGNERDLDIGRVTGTGNSGDLTISTGKLVIRDGARISVSSNESNRGSAGKLTIMADFLELNRGTLNADTAVKEGGNIELKIADTIALSNESQISAKATEDADGGNIDIDTTFILARPNQNSDIIASAERGMGGSITINAEGIVGIQEAPQSEATNDIDASGGVNGQVIINILDVDLTQSPLDDVQNLLETEQTIQQACRATRNTSGNSGSLSILGKEGVPVLGTAPLNSDSIIVEEQYTTSNLQNQQSDIRPITTQYGDLVIARGLVKTEDGRFILTPYSTDNIPRLPGIQDLCRSQSPKA